MLESENFSFDSWHPPNEDEIDRVSSETAKSLHAKLEHKLSANQSLKLPLRPIGPHFVKYTPKIRGPQWNSGANQRFIQIQEMPMDPLEPPKQRVPKVPRGPPDAPVRVMHSPPRAIDPKEAINWKIPAAVSNWKNPKGYIIPLDKRLIVDGRALQETKINDNFAKLSEALYIAEQKAREDTELRNRIVKERALREKEKKDADMRELAMRARIEKTRGLKTEALPAAQLNSSVVSTYPFSGMKNETNVVAHLDNQGQTYHFLSEKKRETLLEQKGRNERDKIREERRRDREKERRLDEAGGHGYKRSKLARDRDRDISERVALGMAQLTAPRGEVMYDQRLLNQDSGLDPGFGAEDGYDVYNKPLFRRSETDHS